MKHDDPDALQARLRQIDQYERQGLMRAEEAAASRESLRKRLMAALMPDVPLPRPRWRARAGALAAMALLVGAVSAYLLSGRAGLRPRAQQLLAEQSVARGEQEAARQERAARAAAGYSVAPDAAGAFHDAPGASAAATTAAEVAPLLAGHVALAPALATRVDPDDAVFIVVRLPGDPDGLPLAAIRKDVSDLPLDFAVRAPELVGAAQRFMAAPEVVVSARVSKSGQGRPQPGDLVGAAPPVKPWSDGVQVVIDGVVKAP